MVHLAAGWRGVVIGWVMLGTAMIASPVQAQPGTGAVYAMTNAAEGNAIVVYDRAVDGTLTQAQTIATGGLGPTEREEPFEPVDALGSQGSLILSPDERWLFAVNAGSNEISVLQIEAATHGLELVDVVNSGGDFPVSLTLDGHLLYVLNSGGDGHITGFTVGQDGRLSPIPDSTRSLKAGGDNPPFFLVSPAQIAFDPWGDMLVVTVKGSNSIHVFPMGDDGLPSAEPLTTTAAGSTPFGFAFSRRGYLAVVEAFGSDEVGTPNAGAVSSYHLEPDGSLRVLSQSVGNFQTATCWLVSGRQPGRRFVYTTNNGSGTVSGYGMDRDGTLSLLNADGVTAATGIAPIDLAVTRVGRFLYVLNAGSGTVSMFEVNGQDGSLTSLGEVGGLPEEDGIAGIAVR